MKSFWLKVTNRLNHIRKTMYNAVYRHLDFFSSLIPGRIGWRVRRFVYSGRVQLGPNVKIDELVSIRGGGKLQIGAHTFIGRGSMIDANGGVIIGENALIGPDVKIWSANHKFLSREIPINKQGHEFDSIHIGDDVWLGVSCIILKGVTIGRGAIVGAGAVVTKDVGEYIIVAGLPAKQIGKR